MSCLTQIARGFAYKNEQQFLVLKAVLVLFSPLACIMHDENYRKSHSNAHPFPQCVGYFPLQMAGYSTIKKWLLCLQPHSKICRKSIHMPV